MWGGYRTPVRDRRGQCSWPVHGGREGIRAKGHGSGSAARWFDNRLPADRRGAVVDGVGRLLLCTVPALLRTQAHAHAAAQPASSFRAAVPSAESAPARHEAQSLAAHRRARLGACEGHVGRGGAHPAPRRDGSCLVSPASGRGRAWRYAGRSRRSRRRERPTRPRVHNRNSRPPGLVPIRGCPWLASGLAHGSPAADRAMSPTACTSAGATTSARGYPSRARTRDANRRLMTIGVDSPRRWTWKLP